jgi:hypothetical protein
MRIQHVAQTVKGWPNDTAANRQESARLADTVGEHIRWRLWHGQVQRALDLIGDTLGALEITAKDATSSVAAAADKVVEVLGIWKLTSPANPGSSSTMRRRAIASSQSQRRPRKVRCSGCCIAA